ncbi:hypothetical protein MALU111345_13520 [Marinicrinis lubricantis]
MKRRSQPKFILVVLLLLTVFAAACGNNGGNSSNGNHANTTGAQAAGENTENTQNTQNDTNDEPVKVIWWHAMGNELGKAVDKLVADFNASQDDYVVEAIFQGSYDESLNKLKSSQGTDQAPALMQVYEIGSRYMIDSGNITPIQKFIDAENYDISDLEENILGYYTFDDRLYSMPFNTSNPILYYNKDMFREAGLDPENPPTTFEEVEEAAKALTKDGKYGASFAIYGWFMEQFFANQGAEYVNNGNGRTEPATASLVNTEAGIKTLNWWKGMVDQKIALNVGRKTDDTKTIMALRHIPGMKARGYVSFQY